MAWAQEDVKERVRQAVDIVDLVGDYLQLRREGSAYKALCPWHDDTKPSLTVNPQRQSFRCWVCDIGGDIFTFVMKREGISFPEALRMLAEKAGIQYAPQSAAAGPSLDEKQALYRAMAWAEKQYHECLLHAPEAAPAREYLKTRRIDSDTVHRFHVGFAPHEWDWLARRAAKEGVQAQTLATVGALGRSERTGRFYDRFRGRLLFSIRDPQSRPVGLGGRILPEFADDKTAKYINSPETPLFAKSKLLYGMDQARDAIAKERVAVVVEGYTDCVIAHQAGLRNFVAVLGTALGEGHIRALRPLADRIVLLLDGDEAGRRRANEVLQLFVAQQVDLRILTLPDDTDPCDFLLEHGAEALQDRLESAVDALEHKFLLASEAAGAGMSAEHEAIEEVLAVLAGCPGLTSDSTSAARLKEAQILNRLAMRFSVGEETLRARLQGLRRDSRRPRRPAADVPEALQDQRQIDPRAESWEGLLLELVLLAPEMFQEVRQTVGPDDFRSPHCRELFETLLCLAEEGAPLGVETLMLRIDDPDLQGLLARLDEEGQRKFAGKDGATIEGSLRETLNNFRWRSTRQRQTSQVAGMRSGAVAEDQGRRVLEQIIEQQRARQGIASPSEG